MSEFLTLMKPELMITIILFILLFLKIAKGDDQAASLPVMISFMLLLNFISGFMMNATGTLFGYMYVTNPLIALEKNILNAGVFIISMQAVPWLKNHKHVAEFYMLMLSTLMGMFFMISSSNLLMFYLGLELSTIPLAALSNFDLSKKQSSEAAMKMIMSSAFASGLLLLGISFFYGTTGTVDFTALSQHMDGSPLQLFAMVLLFTGFAFK